MKSLTCPICKVDLETDGTDRTTNFITFQIHFHDGHQYEQDKVAYYLAELLSNLLEKKKLLELDIETWGQAAENEASNGWYISAGAMQTEGESCEKALNVVKWLLKGII